MDVGLPMDEQHFEYSGLSSPRVRSPSAGSIESNRVRRMDLGADGKLLQDRSHSEELLYRRGYTPVRTPEWNPQDDNKICQWYCCSCGQSYGSIMYKNCEANVEQRNSTSASSSNQGKSFLESSRVRSTTINDCLLQSLKYYSQLVYDKKMYNIHHPIESNYTTGSLEEVHDIEAVSPIVAGRNSFAASTPAISGNKEMQAHNEDERGSFGFDTAPDTVEFEQTESEPESNVLLKVPTRFTCHRCDHMMCPYCPKVRMKDLTN